MRSSLVLLTVLVCFLALTWSAAVSPPEQVNVQQENVEQANVIAQALLDVDSGIEQNPDEVIREARHYGYYGRPIYYGGYGGYGGYGRYGYGYVRPYYGGYGLYGGYGGYGYRYPYYG